MFAGGRWSGAALRLRHVKCADQEGDKRERLEARRLCEAAHTVDSS